MLFIIFLFLLGIIFSQWVQQYSGTNSFLSKVRILDENTGYVIGDSSHVLKITNGGSTYIKNENSQAESFSLYQNYPNPFSSITRIMFKVSLDFSIRGNDRVVLKVFDITGKEVAALVNKNLQAGAYEVSSGVNDLPGGIYFYKINIAGAQGREIKFSETKKAILIK